ncbi:hypothetical protein ASC92_22855 [Variovorax sp. Root411]|nr:hypothetical protein ASC92_22855 [Variovorax sp. Root411]
MAMYAALAVAIALRWNEQTMTLDHRVFVALKRPPRYEDVHAELVMEDAMHQDWPWELLCDEGHHRRRRD